MAAPLQVEKEPSLHTSFLTMTGLAPSSWCQFHSCRKGLGLRLPRQSPWEELAKAAGTMCNWCPVCGLAPLIPVCS